MHDPFLDSRKRQEETELPEWQIDEHGERFRKIGNCIEYAPTIVTTAGTMYADDARDFSKRKKERESERLQAERDAASGTQASRICPFKARRNQLRTNCEKACAFYQGNGCVFASATTAPTASTSGKDCPIAGRCTDKCAMHDNGCRFIELLKGATPGKE